MTQKNKPDNASVFTTYFKKILSTSLNSLTRWSPAILWAVAIFYFSGLPIVKASEAVLIDFIIKKGAHAIEYAILFILITRSQIKKNFSQAFFITLLYAFTDETHQLFTPGRTGTIRDVLIFDTLGISMAWIYLTSKK